MTEQRFFLLAQLVDGVAEGDQRRFSAELLDDVFLRLGDDHRLAERPRALADDGLDLDRAREADADETVGQDLIVAHQRVLARLTRAAGHAADERDAGGAVVEEFQELIQRRGERVAEANEGAGFRAEGGALQDRFRLPVLLAEVERMEAHAGRFADQQRDAGGALDFPFGADDALGGAAGGNLRIQLEPEFFDDGLGLVAVMGGEEDKQHVRLDGARLGEVDQLIDRRFGRLSFSDGGEEAHGAVHVTARRIFRQRLGRR